MDSVATAQVQEAPPGMKKNRYGSYTPESLIKPQLLLEDQTVQQLIADAKQLSEQLAGFRAQAFADIDQFLELLAEKYEAQRGGVKGNVTLESFDGMMRVQVANGDFLTFGPELQAAKTLVDECLTRWSDGARDEIKAIVNDAFDVGKEGKIRVDRVLALRRLDIQDETWCRAMSAIGDAIRITHSKRYVRFYTRPNQDADWKQICLDVARVTG